MKVRIEVEGIPEIQQMLKQLPADVEREVRVALLSLGNKVKDRAIARMHGSKSGREEHRKGRTIKASAPGEAPAIDSGHLAASLYVKPETGLVVDVGSNAVEALWLEKGTRKMAARPFIAPALADVQPEAPKILAAAVDAAIARGSQE